MRLLQRNFSRPSPLPLVTFSLWLLFSVVLGLPILILTATITHVITRTLQVANHLYNRYSAFQNLNFITKNVALKTASIVLPKLMYGLALTVVLGVRLSHCFLSLGRLCCSYGALGVDAIKTRKVVTAKGRRQLVKEFLLLSRLGCSLGMFDIRID